MESDPNPFASPASPSPNTEPILLGFRPNKTAFLVAVPFFAFCVILSIMSVTSASSMDLAVDFRKFGFLSLIAIVSAIGAYGCATVFWCKVSATEHSVVRHDMLRHEIPFSEIETWWHQPFPNSIFLKIKGKRKPLPLNNWAMSKQSKIAVRELLRDRVGPPKRE